MSYGAPTAAHLQKGADAPSARTPTPSPSAMCGRPFRRKRRIRVDGRVGCIHVSGLSPRPLAAGLDEVRGSTPKSPQRALGRLVPVDLAGPRSDRLVITSHYPYAIRLDRGLVRCRAEPELRGGRRRIGSAARQNRPGGARGLVGQATAANLAGLRSSSFAAQHRAALSWRASRMTAVAPMTSRRRG